MSSSALPRRQLLKLLALSGVAHLVTARRADSEQAAFEVTAEALDRCEWLPGIDFTEDERELMVKGVQGLLEDYARLRGVDLPNSVPPALLFDPAPGEEAPAVAPTRSARPSRPKLHRLPESDADLAFASVAELAELLSAGRLSSRELTALSLDRLRRHDERLECVVSLLEPRAKAAARKADDLRAWGRVKSPLHGLPWGAKDLFSVTGARTTWGAKPYEEQRLEQDATVVTRLDEAGAVLAAKLTLGALAWGDVWFGGRTRNPWNLEQGSSGSSAGSAAAVSAGLVPFALGTETYGSIVSPCTRCGVSGLRPTFGRVSRHGAMALSWSMDKVGPIARSAEDCALVFDAIHGADGRDPTAVDRPWSWPLERDPRQVRVGFVPELFEQDRTEGVEDPDRRLALREEQEFDRRVLKVLRDEGFRLKPIALPRTQPFDALVFILSAEAATAFDELTRSGADDRLVRQIENAWPNVFRQSQYVSAVEYLRANRVRTLVMREMAEVFEDVDVYVTPSFGGGNLLLTNLTGHPMAVVPHGFRGADGTPTSITFTGRLFGEAETLAVAHAFQRATDFHRKRPPEFA